MKLPRAWNCRGSPCVLQPKAILVLPTFVGLSWVCPGVGNEARHQCRGATKYDRGLRVPQSSVRRSFPGGSPTGAVLGGIAKRAFDLVFATLALLLLTPLLIAAWTAIRAVIGAPAILVERRIGLAGKVFDRYKFRTIAYDRVGRRSDRAEVIADALRASGIDRLPQLVNVIRGDMSLVGPEYETGAGTPEMFLARPGLTGMRHHASPGLRAHSAQVALDRDYVLHWSMWLDFRIVCDALVRTTHAPDAIRPIK